MIKKVYTDSDGDKIVYDYTYDAEGNLIKEVYTYFDGDKTIYDYTYDTEGNLIKRVYTQSDGKIETWEKEWQFVYIPFDLSEKTEELLEAILS